MPLLDHFRPPLSVRRPWEAFHNTWAATLVQDLNSGLLPDLYYALPRLQVAGRIEVDVGTFRDTDHPDNGGTATVAWAPPRPALSFPVADVGVDLYEVQVFRNLGGPQLRVSIELVSPANKDRPASRRAFAAKCSGTLRRGVSVIVIDVVTELRVSLQAEIFAALEGSGVGDDPATSAPPLSACSYRINPATDPSCLEAWTERLQVGEALPVVPLWLEPDLAIPLGLDESYGAACDAVRIRR